LTEGSRDISTTMSNVKTWSISFWLNKGSLEHCGSVPKQENLNARQLSCSTVILSPQIPHLLAWDRNYALRVDNSVSVCNVEAEDFILKSLQKTCKHFLEHLMPTHNKFEFR
jgi:hypothetical protein